MTQEDDRGPVAPDAGPVDLDRPLTDAEERYKKAIEELELSRKARGITLRNIQELSGNGITHTTAGDVLRARRKVRLSSVRAVVNALDGDVDRIEILWRELYEPSIEAPGGRAGSAEGGISDHSVQVGDPRDVRDIPYSWKLAAAAALTLVLGISAVVVIIGLSTPPEFHFDVTIPQPDLRPITDSVQFSSVTVYDPSGSPDNPESANRAFDGNPTTSWGTFEYSQQFPIPKSGVGLMATSTAVQGGLARVTVKSPDTRGTRIEVRSAPAADVPLSSTQLLGAGTVANGEAVIEFDTPPPPTMHLLLWVTHLGSDHLSGYSAQISDVLVQVRDGSLNTTPTTTTTSALPMSSSPNANSQSNH